MENINIGYASVGMPAIDAREAKFLEARFKAGDAEVWDMYNRGRLSKMTGTFMIGASPAESVETIKKYPGIVNNMPESRMPAIQVLGNAADRVSKMANVDKKDPKAVATAINAEVKKELEVQFSYTNSNPENVFNIGDLRQYLGSTTDSKEKVPAPVSIQNIPVFKKFLVKHRDAGTDLSDPKIVWQMAIAELIAGNITFNDVVELSSVYRAAAHLNMAAKGLVAFGMVPPNSGKNLKVKLGRFSGSIIDITDPVQVSNQLSKDLANKIYQTERYNQLTGEMTQ
jgi:hypothetical protein